MNHQRYMRRALELAVRGKGNVAPNPMVGAVLVYNDRIIGEGWHEQYGFNHAEVNCLENVAAGDKHLIPESTMYVTLEPCAHHGKTPPCATRLVAEKVKKVVIANVDPFEKVAGRGITILKEAGINVETGILEQDASWVNRRFFTFHQKKRPYIILKWAQSAEGFFAPADGSRKQLSNHFSQTMVHRWRTQEAGILVGFNTALADNPQLTARFWPGKQPTRIVLDRHLHLPQGLLLMNDVAPTIVVNELKEEIRGNIHYLKSSFGELFEKLHALNIQSIIIEGGAKTLNTIIEQGLWDEARIFQTLVSIEKGIPAPLLSDARMIFETAVESDLLRIFTPQDLYPTLRGLDISL